MINWNDSVLVGSSATCSEIPGFVPKDVDRLLFLYEPKFQEGIEMLVNLGYTVDGDYGENSTWISLKKYMPLTMVTQNYILTKDFVWYQNFLRANELCKKLQLADKDKRIAVHKAFLGET